MSPEGKDLKIKRLEQENQALREKKIAKLERRLGLDSPRKFKTTFKRWIQKEG